MNMQLDNINQMNFNKISNHPQAQTQKQQTQQVCSSNDKSGSYEGDVCSSNRNLISSNKSQSIDAYADADTDVDDMNNNMVTKFAFPFKLHSILENAEKMNRVDIVSWLPSGKAFKIHKPKDFADTIMPQYFNQTKYRSFQRQLYIYNFDRVKDKASNEYGAYVHELFIRGDSDLCVDMTRQKIKGTGLSNEERRQKAALSKKKKKVYSTINSKHNSNTPIDDNTVKISMRKQQQQQQQQQQQSYPSIKSNTATTSSYQQPLSLNQNRKQLAALLSSSKNILTSSSLLSPSSIITPTPFMSSSSSMHPSLDVQSSSSIGSSMNSNTVQQQEQLPRRVSEWNTRLEQMLSSRKPFLQQQQQQQQRKGIPRRVSEWNNDAIALAAIRQQQQQQQHSFQMNINTNNNNSNNIINSNSSNYNNSFQYLNGENNNNSGGGVGRTNTNNHYGRRCSLGFDRSVGRRNSLLHDGDVVNFNNKQFFFTTEY